MKPDELQLISDALDPDSRDLWHSIGRAMVARQIRRASTSLRLVPSAVVDSLENSVSGGVEDIPPL